jgi:hypothetical protein
LRGFRSATPSISCFGRLGPSPLQETSQGQLRPPQVPCAHFIRTSIYDKCSGSTNITTHLNHISHCETSFGANWLNRWTNRVCIINTRANGFRSATPRILRFDRLGPAPLQAPSQGQLRQPRVPCAHFIQTSIYDKILGLNESYYTSEPCYSL